MEKLERNMKNSVPDLPEGEGWVHEEDRVIRSKTSQSWVGAHYQSAEAGGRKFRAFNRRKM